MTRHVWRVAKYLAIGLAVAVVTSTTASAALPADGPVVYVVGDSITLGTGVTDPTRSYANVVLDRVYGRDHSAGRIVAHGGQCLVFVGCAYPTPLVKSWAPEVLNATPTPTTIVLLIGVNDLQHATVSDMETAYMSLVQQASDLGIRVIVGTITPRDANIWWPSYWDWGPQEDQINTWIRATFGSNVADFNTALKNPAVDNWGARTGTMSTDGLHPSVYGAADMAYAVPIGI